MGNIFLIGFMGTGKSTVARELSARAAAQGESAEYIEMDQRIEEEQGMPITGIFEKRGEAYFRDLETDLLRRLAERAPGAPRLIVSCGGGAAVREENVRLMKKAGWIVLLQATPDTVLRRVRRSKDRPILNGNMNRAFIASLMEKRRAAYEAAADLTVSVDGRKVPQICDEIARKTKALEVIDRLKKEYPLAACTLNYEDAWQLLVSVRLAAQCTDARVDMVTPKLYEKFPTVDALAAADPAEIEEIVKPCGLGHSKARDISACMRVLRDQYGGRVPDDMKSLLALPGVGIKSANLILGDIFGKPAIVTDTHCIRLCNLIGLVDGIKEPAKVEKALWEIIPPEEGNDLCHRFVLHGRAVCVARRPQCDKCCLRDICRYAIEKSYE